MSAVVRLNVPPFAPLAPTSLAALRRPLVREETTRCDSHCQPCETCRTAQDAAVASASRLSADTALRLSQLVEDAVAQNIARIQTEQAQLVTSVLTAVLPHLANTALRSALADELQALAEPLETLRMRLAKSPTLELGELPDHAYVTLEDDPALIGNVVELRVDGGATRLDADARIAACLVRLSLPEE